FLGQETEVLFEKSIQYGGQQYMVGHNGRYIKYALQTEENLSNICIKGYIIGDFVGEIPLIGRKQSK
ncbi:MAG: tRNA (N(6)-L-threonylcarbamoyladenosine(37)-C(2))-methylthiotransferase MtaB, partial [Lachnospiraceae bacterium]|nr:tRNA (N(6)-L-threonylcarbamoyladenosine(37)-C(2))-methylthiotransferase MtaB [Lachnospiraceae bacterium]